MGIVCFKHIIYFHSSAYSCMPHFCVCICILYTPKSSHSSHIWLSNSSGSNGHFSTLVGLRMFRFGGQLITKECVHIIFSFQFRPNYFTSNCNRIHSSVNWLILGHTLLLAVIIFTESRYLLLLSATLHIYWARMSVRYSWKQWLCRRVGRTFQCMFQGAVVSHREIIKL